MRPSLHNEREKGMAKYIYPTIIRNLMKARVLAV